MKTVALKTMCVLLCAVCISAQVMPMPDFDLEKMGGKWYLVGFATNVKHYKDEMKMATATMVPTEDGDFNLSYSHLNGDGSCFRMHNLAKKTEVPGRFVFYNKIWGNSNDMHVVDAKFDEYAFVHTIKTKGGESEILNKLHTRTTNVTDDLMEKFKQFSLDTGILEENIAILPMNGTFYLRIPKETLQNIGVNSHFITTDGDRELQSQGDTVDPEGQGGAGSSGNQCRGANPENRGGDGVTEDQSGARGNEEPDGAREIEGRVEPREVKSCSGGRSTMVQGRA
ncbi:lipocalin-like [Garra rufa]|uniref:lipocalin-like n=1 Tax=Garra rufa TaxID=137080 RepID=UPI003CCEEE62